MSNIPNSAMPHAGSTSPMTGTATNSTGSAAVETPLHDQHGDVGQSREAYAGDTGYSDRQGRFRERLGNHKVAIAVAAGAVTAAAAIPFMLSARKKSTERPGHLRADIARSGRSRSSYDYDIVTGERSGMPPQT